MGVYRAEYIWIDGTQPTQKLRSKTKIVPSGSRRRLFPASPGFFPRAPRAGAVRAPPAREGSRVTRPREHMVHGGAQGAGRASAAGVTRGYAGRRILPARFSPGVT